MTRVLACCCAATLLIAAAPAAAPQPPGGPAVDRYQAIRTGDLPRLKTLVTTPEDANARGPLGSTPLMDAAVAGSVEAMALLIEHGADVNAQNPFGTTALMMSATDIAKVRLLLDRGADVNRASKQGRTALFVAAMSEPSAAIVKLLIAKGADVRAKDAFQNTMLTAAAYGNDLATIRLMLDAGIDVNAAGITNVTPLLGAAYHGNAEAVRLLLSKGARANTVAKVPILFPGDQPKSGPVSITDISPLLAAASGESADLVKALVDAGADVNARDGRGMTPLMLAVATNHQNPAVIRLLLARGADATVQSKVGETAADWARKLAAPAGLQLLHTSRLQPIAAAVAAPAAASIDARAAAERGLALLETSSQKFFEASGCVSCHHQNITGFAAGEARTRGVRFDPKASAARVDMLKDGPPPQLLLERMDINVPEIFASALVALAAENVPPNPVTDMIAANLAATQAADGSWHIQNGLGHRPPSAEGAISRTAMCIRSLAVYGAPGRRGEMTARIGKARQWLAAAKPLTSEDGNMQLLGLYWADGNAAALKPLSAAILARQQPDGAWRQHDGVATDAYATGQSLYALAKAGGVPPTDAAYQRGVDYLLATQNANGSWRVTSRAPKFQAFFNSGFPYGGDQWISAWATGWATMALTQAVPAPGRAVSDR
ncbi:MAG: Ankyrin [Acidobacteria bacterium]|nr:Ankyrin [Acidobacteriota bacterium]